MSFAANQFRHEFQATAARWKTDIDAAATVDGTDGTSATICVDIAAREATAWFIMCTESGAVCGSVAGTPSSASLEISTHFAVAAEGRAHTIHALS